jgi:hypothetical protein
MPIDCFTSYIHRLVEDVKHFDSMQPYYKKHYSEQQIHSRSHVLASTLHPPHSTTSATLLTFRPPTANPFHLSVARWWWVRLTVGRRVLSSARWRVRVVTRGRRRIASHGPRWRIGGVVIGGWRVG